MRISKIENIHSNTCYNQKNTSSSFKGTASPEFVKYVNELRGDCLQIVPKRSAKFINNVCDNIINKAQRVMKNCFPQESVLSVDTNNSVCEDFITYSNKVLKKYIPDYRACRIGKKGYATNINRLIKLHRAIFGDYFADASAKDYINVFSLAHYLESMNIYNESFSKDCIPIFEFYYNKINLLKSETNADKHCLLKTQNDYAKLMSDLKEIG